MATAKKKIVISASRRTDLPAHHLGWLMDCVERGEAPVDHPYTGQTAMVPLTPETVHSLVLWTKNPGPMLETGALDHLLSRGFRLFVNLTVNSPHPILEPGVPLLKKRLALMKALSDAISPACINWRFDPICHFENDQGQTSSNLTHFDEIAEAASDAGITRCVTSFVDLYPKVMKRCKAAGFMLTDPPIHEKVATVLSLSDRLVKRGISLFTCCENEVQNALPFGCGIEPSACIPGELLGRLFGGDLSLAKDSGQRKEHGCRCTKSREIGSYGRHPCPTNCLYCYGAASESSNH